MQSGFGPEPGFRRPRTNPTRFFIDFVNLDLRRLKPSLVLPRPNPLPSWTGLNPHKNTNTIKFELGLGLGNEHFDLTQNLI